MPAVVAAFLVPGSPLPYVQRDNPPWGRLAAAMEAAHRALEAARPDTLVVYSTQWLAVLDQLWQTRPHLQGIHVDENWHEYGELSFDFGTDVDLADACIRETVRSGIQAKGVNYDQFPVDTGTIVATNFLNPDGSRPLVIAANNVYHDWERTVTLGGIAAHAATRLGRRIAGVGVGGLSGSFFRRRIEPARDRIASDTDDQWNRRILGLIEGADLDALAQQCPRFAAEAKADMGFKHFAFVLGALGGKFRGATVHGYGPLYGAGGAVVEFRL
ncbi:MAG: tRNA U-34 5-methylaminomethyl-2-thiouridine biosynthesis protein [Gammaproteobacteria bacterium]